MLKRRLRSLSGIANPSDRVCLAIFIFNWILAHERAVAFEGLPTLPVETLQLHSPPLQEVAQVLDQGLRHCFANASVSVADSPDLTRPPFYLAAKGLNGRPTLVDVGDISYLLPSPVYNKTYNLDAMAEMLNFSGAFILGSGAGPFHRVGTALELIANLKTRNGSQSGNNLSFGAKINSTTGDYEVFSIPWTSDFAFLLQSFVSEGKDGQVLEVRASHRTGDTNIVDCMAEALKGKYGSSQIFGMGGVLLVRKGIIRTHIMTNFTLTPLHSPESDWLKFFNMTAPMICPSVIVTHDPGLKLYLRHAHCFSHHGAGGHYYKTVTPDDVDYLGYYLPAKRLYRIDRPNATVA